MSTRDGARLRAAARRLQSWRGVALGVPMPIQTGRARRPGERPACGVAMADGPRIAREKKTLLAMVRVYCHDIHRRQTAPCEECQELLAYALSRLEKCPFQEDKSTCTRCPVHCYRPDMRMLIRTVMRHAGPRMLLRHPVLAVLHLLDGRRRTPERVRAHG